MVERLLNLDSMIQFLLMYNECFIFPHYFSINVIIIIVNLNNSLVDDVILNANGFLYFRFVLSI